MNTQPKINLLNNILLSALGFGLGGLYWGWEIYKYDVLKVEISPSLFAHLFAGLIMGILGGIFLSLIYKKDFKIALKVILLGTIGIILGFLVGIVGDYYIGWGPLLPIGLIPGPYPDMTWESLTSVGSSLILGNKFWTFAIVGFIIGIFYALALKKKVLKTAILGMIGFALGSIIAPIIGNLFASLT